MPTTKKKILNDEEQYNEDVRLNIAIRETFLNRFVHIFLMYENFVIMPDQVSYFMFYVVMVFEIFFILHSFKQFFVFSVIKY